MFHSENKAKVGIEYLISNNTKTGVKRYEQLLQTDNYSLKNNLAIINPAIKWF